MNSDSNDARVLDSAAVPLAKLELFEMKLQNIIFLNENLVKRNNELNRKFLDLEMAAMKKKNKKLKEKLKVNKYSKNNKYTSVKWYEIV
jgi:hypothetical protein